MAIRTLLDVTDAMLRDSYRVNRRANRAINRMKRRGYL
jgi:hypothetical protein